jgi:hypothetical protein
MIAGHRHHVQAVQRRVTWDAVVRFAELAAVMSIKRRVTDEKEI